jgi:hypothetical protein
VDGGSYLFVRSSGGVCPWRDGRLIQATRRQESKMLYVQIRAVLSPLPVANIPPRGLISSDITGDQKVK